MILALQTHVEVCGGAYGTVAVGACLADRDGVLGTCFDTEKSRLAVTARREARDRIWPINSIPRFACNIHLEPNHM